MQLNIFIISGAKIQIGRLFELSDIIITLLIILNLKLTRTTHTLIEPYMHKASQDIWNELVIFRNIDFDIKKMFD